MEKDITVYYDQEGDFLEVLFEKAKGYFKETDNDSVMEKISDDNRIIGFSILNISKITSKEPINAHLQNA